VAARGCVVGDGDFGNHVCCVTDAKASCLVSNERFTHSLEINSTLSGYVCELQS
jgi:hypothetical protein